MVIKFSIISINREGYSLKPDWSIIMKPRFPISVTRVFKYRARIYSTGDILECDSFKTLYKVTRSHLRTEVLYNETEYKYSDAVLEFGYSTDYEISRGHWYSEWTQIKDYGCLQVSTISESFYSTEDESNHIFRGVYGE